MRSKASLLILLGVVSAPWKAEMDFTVAERLRALQSQIHTDTIWIQNSIASPPFILVR